MSTDHDMFKESSQRARLQRTAEQLRIATAAALALESWFAPTLDDCRVDAERLLALDDDALDGSAAHSLHIRSDLALRTWHKLVATTRNRRQPCGQCGGGTMLPLARAGRRAPFRGVELEIPSDFAILTCDHCDAELLDGETARRLDDLLFTAWSQRALDPHS